MTIDINKKCINCRFLYTPDQKQLENSYSCVVNHDNYGFWKKVKPTKDYCSWFKPKTKGK